MKLFEVDWPKEIYDHPDAGIELSEDGKPLFRGMRVRMGLHTGEPMAEQDPVTRRTGFFPFFCHLFIFFLSTFKFSKQNKKSKK